MGARHMEGAVMEFRTMSYFVAVAEELHFGRAAARMNIAQPALSLQIKALEKDLGVKLLVRNTRRVQLTEAGQVFYKRCLGILHEMEASRVLTQSVAGKEIGKITIGTIYPATFGVLPIFLSKIGQRYPNIQIHIKSGTTNDIIRDLEQGKTNVGFLRTICWRYRAKIHSPRPRRSRSTICARRRSSPSRAPIFPTPRGTSRSASRSTD